jgi:hypothetical protein
MLACAGMSEDPARRKSPRPTYRCTPSGLRRHSLVKFVVDADADRAELGPGKSRRK